jgi:hypothetical protein
MTNEVLALIASYFLCSEAAEVRVLSSSEIDTCTQIYTEVKLTFVEGMDLGSFSKLPVRERALINNQGYAGYVAWRVQNPELVAQMEETARNQLGFVGN